MVIVARGLTVGLCRIDILVAGNQPGTYRPYGTVQFVWNTCTGTTYNSTEEYTYQYRVVVYSEPENYSRFV
jgi:hypothetical protein